jgi:hypothetical protein
MQERMADSRPFPGPFILSLFKSCFNSYFTTSSAAGCVFFEPLKPILPAEDQEILTLLFVINDVIEGSKI